MDWSNLISVVSELVKEDSIRSQIYKRLLDASDWSEKDAIEEECLGYDDAFDEVWNEFYAEDDEDSYDDDDDSNYEFDE